jgi:hypothetical protein
MNVKAESIPVIGGTISRAMKYFDKHTAWRDHQKLKIQQDIDVFDPLDPHTDNTRIIRVNYEIGVGHGGQPMKMDSYSYLMFGKPFNNVGKSRNIQPGFGYTMTTWNEDDKEWDGLTLSSLRPTYPDLISDSDIEVERLALLRGIGTWDTTIRKEGASNIRSYATNDELHWTVSQMWQEFTDDERILDSKAVMVNLGTMATIANELHKKGGIAESYVYAQMNNNCSDFAEDMFELIAGTGPKYRTDNINQNVISRVLDAQLDDTPLDMPTLIEYMKIMNESHLVGLERGIQNYR